MKKKLLIIISFAAILLAWCNNSQIVEIDPSNWTSNEWLSLDDAFNQQVEDSQYIQDLQDFLSYNTLLMAEDKPFVSDMSLNAKFDDKSSIKWWIDFSQNKYSKAHDMEDMEINFDIRAEEPENDLEPFYASWDLSLVYQNKWMYANIHNFWVYMWEGNMVAKMYTLLWNSFIGQWIDLEANSGWVVTINEKEDIKLQYILWTLKNVLKTQWVNEDSPNFLNGIVELIDTVNSHVDLWISTKGLTLLDFENKYFQLSDDDIQRGFTGSFKWDESEFSLSFTVSKKWLQIYVYDIKEFDEDSGDYVSNDVEFELSIKENKKSEYYVKIQSLKAKQTVANIQWHLKYDNQVNFVGNFILEPLELAQWQKISWNMELKIIKKAPNGDEIFPEVSWEIVSLTSILSSL